MMRKTRPDSLAFAPFSVVKLWAVPETMPVIGYTKLVIRHRYEPPMKPKTLKLIMIQRRPRISERCPTSMKPTVRPTVHTMEKKLETSCG